jgi:hypothetical protein
MLLSYSDVGKCDFWHTTKHMERKLKRLPTNEGRSLVRKALS